MTIEQQANRPGSRGMVVLWVAVGLFLLVVIGLSSAQHSDRPRASLSERVKTSCNEQYGDGSEASTRCQIALMATAVEKDQAGRLDAAKRGAGL